MLDNNTGYLTTSRKVYKTTNAGGTGLGNKLLPENKVLIYPNPTEGIVNIESRPGLRITGIKLIDLTGRTVNTFNANDRVLDIGAVSPGIYFLYASTQEGVAIKKIVRR